MMFKEGMLPFASYTALLFLLLAFQSCNARKNKNNNDCLPSSCGTVNISRPFRLNTHPTTCGDKRYTLYCENNLTVALYSTNQKYYVQEIDYNSNTIRVVDAGFDEQDCSSVPRVPLVPLGLTYERFGNEKNPYLLLWRGRSKVLFVKCANPVNHPLYIDRRASCRNGSSAAVAAATYLYAIVGNITVRELMEQCAIEMMFPLLPPFKNSFNTSFLEIHRQVAYGFELKWCDVGCRYGCVIDLSGQVICRRLYGPITIALLTIASYFIVTHQTLKTVCGTPFVIAFLVYKWRRRHLSTDDSIEEFLQSQNNFMPVRYSYSDIKKMTGNFKDKLGEGGFGSVFKGKLRSGSFAAIKLLGQSKSNGQDFINEVATIGMIHHANVVQLIGFCVEGSKRALVYEFMPNGSLNNYIFPGKETVNLSWEMLHKISLGVARAIEYLHHGCSIQILHFDIKPHNILLNEKFLPKVSDFGLAKLYPRNDSIASLTVARGTIGYMAPELFYKNIGRVSYKADVYSFGMLLLEMAGKRRNLDATAKNSSQIYFPLWVYDQLLNGKGIRIEDATKEESKIAEKIGVVGLWCIQMKPDDRPSMNKVVEMLEGGLESLELPRKPILYPEEMPIKDEEGGNHGQPSISSLVVDPIESISSIVTS